MFAKTDMPARVRAKLKALRDWLFRSKREEPVAQVVAQKTKKQFDVSIGSGGVKANLGGIGFVLLLRLSKIDQLVDVVVANSGGFVPGACLKSSLDTKTMLTRSLDTDFGALIMLKTNHLQRLWALLRKQRFEVTMPTGGVYCARNYAAFINSVFSRNGLPYWPERFMAVASSKSRHMVVIASDGVYKYADGRKMQLSAEPPTLGDAAHAAAALPGIIDSKRLHGEDLFDGVLCGDGRCQISPIAMHYGDRGHKLIVFDVGEDGIKKSFWMQTLWTLFRFGLKGGDLESLSPVESDKVIVVNCRIEGFHGLQFSLPPEDKWRSIILGYLATARRLGKARLIGARTHPEVYELARDFRRALKDPASLPQAVEDALAKRGLW